MHDHDIDCQHLLEDLSVYLDGDKELEARDEDFARGTFALHAWGCAGASFRNIVWRDANGKSIDDR